MAGASRMLPQVLPPGLPASDEPFSGSYEIVWSIYIRCKSLQKLREVHIPALEALIGQPHGGQGWLYDNERYIENRNRSLKRIVAVKHVPGPYSDQMFVDFTKTLYSLSPYWTIQARLDHTHPHGVYVCASFKRESSQSEAPAIVDALVEFTPNFTASLGGESGRYLGSGRRLS